MIRDATTQVGEGTGTYREAAEATIAAAITGREKSPYMRLFVQFHNHLAGVAPGPAEKPSEPESGVDDFFND